MSSTGELTLVVLAAGLSRRYGALKQLEPVGPGGATLLDYSVFDAFQVGFRRLVLVTRSDLARAFAASGPARRHTRMDTHVVVQRADDLPEGRPAAGAPRLTPWGTGHAVLAARRAVTGNFAVLNADDLYGQPALEAVARFLAQADPREACFAVVAYRLAHTASESGGVNRAVLEVTPDGRLWSLREFLDLRPEEPGWFSGRGPEGRLERVGADAPVSMNLWGFTPRVFEILEAGFRRFLERGPGPAEEFLLQVAIHSAVATGRATVRVLACESSWCGLTHPGDLARVRAHVASLTSRGLYPERM